MRTAACVATSALAVAFTGCTTIQTTTPARSATEQLLLSTSVDRALADVDLGIFANKKVYLDTNYFDSYDPKYATGTIRDALSRQGAVLVDNAAASDVIIEARSGALSIDNSDTLFGIPALGVPIPLAGSVTTPEIAIYKADRQHAFAKLVLLAYVRQTREHVYSSGNLDGISYNKHYHLLGASWLRTDIPEKHHDSSKTNYVVWQPQYDRQALIVPPEPGTNAVPANTNLVPKNTPPDNKAATTNQSPVNVAPPTNAPSEPATNSASI